LVSLSGISDIFLLYPEFQARPSSVHHWFSKFDESYVVIGHRRAILYFLPLIVWYCRPKIPQWILALLIIVAITVRYYVSVVYPDNAIVWGNTISNLDLLSAGGLLAIFFRRFDTLIIRNMLVALVALFFLGYYLALHYILNVHLFLWPFSRDGLHG
jgi:hypothetical protein